MARHFTRPITTPAAARMVREWPRPFISLLSDFGSRDPSAGIMRGVVQGIAPEALVVDISHDVDKFQVADGALLLWCALPYMPVGSHVAVVDPGVGTERHSVALETARGDYLIGPDNGLLIPGATRLGGVVRGHRLENPQYRLPVVSSSFHGRDLFAPAAAHLALGVPLEALGSQISPRSLTSLDWPEPILDDGSLTASVIYIDTFGNVKLGALGSELDGALRSPTPGTRLRLEINDRAGTRAVVVAWADTFGSVPLGETLLYSDSYGRLCLAVNRGSVAASLGLAEGAVIVVTRAGRGTSSAPTMDALARPDRQPTEEPGPPSFAAEPVAPAALSELAPRRDPALAVEPVPEATVDPAWPESDLMPLAEPASSPGPAAPPPEEPEPGSTAVTVDPTPSPDPALESEPEPEATPGTVTEAEPSASTGRSSRKTPA